MTAGLPAIRRTAGCLVGTLPAPAPLFLRRGLSQNPRRGLCRSPHLRRFRLLRRAPATTSAAPPPASTYYKNCTAARDAGAAPVRAGDPGYGRHLDRDGDGIGCEN